MEPNLLRRRGVLKVLASNSGGRERKQLCTKSPGLTRQPRFWDWPVAWPPVTWMEGMDAWSPMWWCQVEQQLHFRGHIQYCTQSVAPMCVADAQKFSLKKETALLEAPTAYRQNTQSLIALLCAEDWAGVALPCLTFAAKSARILGQGWDECLLAACFIAKAAQEFTPQVSNPAKQLPNNIEKWHVAPKVAQTDRETNACVASFVQNCSKSHQTWYKTRRIGLNPWRTAWKGPGSAKTHPQHAETELTKRKIRKNEKNASTARRNRADEEEN